MQTFQGSISIPAGNSDQLRSLDCQIVTVLLAEGVKRKIKSLNDPDFCYIGEAGEITANRATGKLYFHDGVRPGGVVIIRKEDDENEILLDDVLLF